MSNLYDISDVLKKLKYPHVSLNVIKSSGDRLVANAKKWLSQHQRYNLHDSRTLAFRALKRNRFNNVELLGIVSKYKLIFNPFYKQASLYILLRYVCGFNYNNQFKYLTDHLWIDVNLSSLETLHNWQIGLGDYLWVRGNVQAYHGHINQIYGYKISLNSDARILQVGYPLFKGNKFTGQIIPYRHKNYLYQTFGYKRCIKLGNEISSNDRQRIRKYHYYVGYSALGFVGKIIHQGLHLKTKKNNPKLVITKSDSLNMINNLKWIKKDNRYNIILASAKHLKQHPRLVEEHIDKILKPYLKKSYDNALAWNNLHVAE